MSVHNSNNSVNCKSKVNKSGSSKPMEWCNLFTIIGKEIRIAIDTEFQGNQTLTIQCSARVGDELRVQLYYSPEIPAPPAGCFGKSFSNRFPVPVKVMQPKPISPVLSPARMLADLFGLLPATHLSRYEGDLRRLKLLETSGNAIASGNKGRKTSRLPQLPRIDVTMVGHFLRADFLRAFGRDFYKELLAPSDRRPSVALRDSKVIGFSGTEGLRDVFSDPVVEYVAYGGKFYQIRLGTMDTNCVCGSISLDNLAKSYLGVAKDDSIGEEEKQNMKKLFCDPSRSVGAYRYAVQDAILGCDQALLVWKERSDGHFVKFRAVVQRVRVPPDQS